MMMEIISSPMDDFHWNEVQPLRSIATRPILQIQSSSTTSSTKNVPWKALTIGECEYCALNS